MAEQPPETIWFVGESGVLQCMDRSKMSYYIIQRMKAGVLRQVNEDGTPWAGEPFWIPRLPEETTISTLRGYRYWSVGENGVLSSAQGFTWPPGEWAEAECKVCSRAGRPIPWAGACRNYGYGCGLYAANTATREIRQESDHHTWGVIEAKGRIVAHHLGFRAQHARIIALARPRAGDGTDPLAAFRNAHREAAAETAAQLYGVPLLPPDALVAEYAPDVADWQRR